MMAPVPLRRRPATGGHFYPAADEDTMVRALQDIDRLSLGATEIKQYVVDQPRFAGFALIAAGLWMIAITLKLTIPQFSTLP